METIELLSRIPLFGELTPADLQNLAAHTEARTYQKDDIIFHQGDASGALFFIKTGAVEIFIPHKDAKKPLTLTTLSEGQFFGELSLFDRQPHSASVRAIAPSDMLLLKRDTLLAFIERHPHCAIALLSEMSRRLRQTNDALNRQVSRNVYDEIDRKATLTDRMADKVASFGGSWKFILSFLTFSVLWMVFNVGWLAFRPFDVFPYQFLNLVLAVIAALQAPFIMMSQNRQSDKDRLSAKVDFEVNRKNELGIELLLRKMDAVAEALKVQTVR